MHISIEIKEIKEDICPICLQEFSEDKQNKENNYKHLECKNYFHTQCISEWLKINETCPMCRLNINRLEVRPTPTLCGHTFDFILCVMMVVNFLLSFTVALLVYFLA